MKHNKHKHKKGETARLAAELAPLEELDKATAAQQMDGGKPAPKTNGNHGSIVIENTDLGIPTRVFEGSSQKTILGMEPVAIVILIIMLAFIGFIAWQITLMPDAS